jgi:hypothetical protein
MELSSILSLLGSIASIGAIPLSIYLYLRAQEEKVASARRDILRTLSYQLGDARPVTLFEIEAVTESVLRSKRLKGDAISPVEVVNDLVTETISNPMISPDRKGTILLDLEHALLTPPIRSILAEYQLSPNRLLSILDNRSSGRTAARAAKSKVVFDEHEVGRRHALTSTVFGVLAALTSLGAVVFQFTDTSPRLRELLGRLPAQDFLLGLIAAVVAASLSLVTGWLFDNQAKRREPGDREVKPKSERAGRLRPSALGGNTKRRR